MKFRGFRVWCLGSLGLKAFKGLGFRDLRVQASRC